MAFRESSMAGWDDRGRKSPPGGAGLPATAARNAFADSFAAEAAPRTFFSACGMAVLAALTVTGCQPSVAVRAPEEPITINLNIKLDAEVRVKLEEQAEKDIEQNPEVF